MRPFSWSSRRGGSLPSFACPHCKKKCRTKYGLTQHINRIHLLEPEAAPAGSTVQTSAYPPVDPPAQAPVEITTFNPQAPVSIEITDSGRVTVIGEPAEAEEGEITLAEEKPTLTKETLKVLLEEVLNEQQEEKDKQALQKAVQEAAAGSTEARELAGKACKGVECIQEAIDLLGSKLETIAQTVAEPPEEIQPTPAPVIAAPPVSVGPPVQPIVAPQPAFQPVVAPIPEPVQEEEHHHDHPAHLTSASMAEGVLDRIMSCEHCSPAMKEALKRRLHVYLPDELGRVGEEASVGDEGSNEAKTEAREEAKAPAEEYLEQHPVAGGEEPALSEAKAKAEAGGAAGLESDGAAAEPAAEPTGDAPTNADGADATAEDKRAKFNDPLNWI
jgi:hypothetical protein